MFQNTDQDTFFANCYVFKCKELRRCMHYSPTAKEKINIVILYEGGFSGWFFDNVMLTHLSNKISLLFFGT